LSSRKPRAASPSSSFLSAACARAAKIWHPFTSTA
jgi:hypothetical protein